MTSIARSVVARGFALLAFVGWAATLATVVPATAARLRRRVAELAATLAAHRLPPGRWVPNEARCVLEAGDPFRPHLRMYRKTPTGVVERLHNGAFARAGDRVQVTYTVSEVRFGAVLSIDGGGAVTWHLPPERPGPAARLGSAAEATLPWAFELDDAPGFERFVMVVADAPFDTSSLPAALRGTAALPPGTVATSFVLTKD